MDSAQYMKDNCNMKNIKDTDSDNDDENAPAKDDENVPSEDSLNSENIHNHFEKVSTDNDINNGEGEYDDESTSPTIGRHDNISGMPSDVPSRSQDRVPTSSGTPGTVHWCINYIYYILFLILSITVVITLPNIPIFKNLEGAHKIVELQDIICKINNDGSFSKIELEPWNEGFEKPGYRRSLYEMYINRKFYTDSQEYSNLLEVVSEDNNQHSKRFVLVAEKGSGKTTAVKELFKDWCNNIRKESNSFRIFKFAIQNYFDGIVQDNVRWNVIYSNIFTTFPGFLYEFITKSIYDEGTIFNNLSLLYNKLTKIDKIPRLIFAFEFRNIINLKTLLDIIFQSISNGSDLYTKENLSIILNKESNRILLILDGWDEYSKLRYDTGSALEIDAIIKREEKKDINLIVTTRPWRSDELLNIPQYKYKKISLYNFQLPKDRDIFIHKFFPAGPDASELINVLNENDTIVPEELQRQPRMLVYICNAWKYDKNVRIDRMKNKEIFWDAIWKMMMHTYNNKYPQNPMSYNDLKKIRHDIGIYISNVGKDKKILFEDFFDKFGDSDLFYFGIFSTDSYHMSAPWNEDADDNIEQYVKPFLPSMVEEQANIEVNSKSEKKLHKEL